MVSWILRAPIRWPASAESAHHSSLCKEYQNVSSCNKECLIMEETFARRGNLHFYEWRIDEDFAGQKTVFFKL